MWTEKNPSKLCYLELGWTLSVVESGVNRNAQRTLVGQKQGVTPGSQKVSRSYGEDE